MKFEYHVIATHSDPDPDVIEESARYASRHWVAGSVFAFAHDPKINRIEIRVVDVGRNRTIRRVLTPKEINMALVPPREVVETVLATLEHHLENDAARAAEKTARHGAAFGFGARGFDVYRREFRDRDRASPVEVWEEGTDGTRWHYDVRTPKALSAAMKSVHASSQHRTVELRTDRGGRLTVNRGATKSAIHRWLEEQAALASGTVVSIGQCDRASASDAIRCAHERINELEKWRANMTDTTKAALDEFCARTAELERWSARTQANSVNGMVDIHHVELESLNERLAAIERHLGYGEQVPTEPR